MCSVYSVQYSVCFDQGFGVRRHLAAQIATAEVVCCNGVFADAVVGDERISFPKFLVLPSCDIGCFGSRKENKMRPFGDTSD